MNIIDKNLLNEGSFTDTTILQVDLDVNNKIMLIETDGADLNDGYLLKAKIIIENWSQLEVVERDDDNIKKPVDNPKKFLTSIIEFHYDGSELRLVGVGYKCWVDWIFTKPKVTIYGDIDPNPPKV